MGVFRGGEALHPTVDGGERDAEEMGKLRRREAAVLEASSEKSGSFGIMLKLRFGESSLVDGSCPHANPLGFRKGESVFPVFCETCYKA
jgi:hypothetical protein